MRFPTMMLAVVLATTAGPAMSQSRPPVTMDALLSQEAFGRVRIDPAGRWVVVERRAAWGSATTYRHGLMTAHLLGALDIHDAAGGPTRTIEDPAHAEGYVSGPFSPSGERMMVFRLDEARRRLGILTLASGVIDWLPVTPEHTALGRTVAWRSETQVVVIARPEDDLPLLFRLGSQTTTRKAALWANFEAGDRSSATTIPSGRRRDDRRQATPSTLLLIDLPSGDKAALARGEFFDLEVSPDGHAVAALANAEDLQPDLSEAVRVGSPSRRRRLLMVDLDRRLVQEPLPGQDFLSHLLSWSPDGRRLLAFGRADGEAWTAGRFWSLDAAGTAAPLQTGQDVPWIQTEPSGIPIVQAGWSGHVPVVQVRNPEGERLWRRPAPRPVATPVMTEREVLVGFSDQAWIQRPDGLYRLDGRDVVPGQPWRAEDDSGGRQRWNPTIDHSRGMVLRDGCIVRLKTPPPTPACLSGLTATDPVLAVSPSGDFAVSRRQEGAATILRLHRADGVQVLSTLNTALKALDWGRIEPLPHAGPNGEALTSWLLLPHATTGAPPPVAVVMYPGATYPVAPAWLGPAGERRHINPSVLAAAGYAVLVPSLPRNGAPGPGLDDLAQRIGEIVDQAADRGWVDRDRIALIGHSYGAYGALLAATQSGRFRAVVASAGYTDLTRSFALPPHFLVSPDDGVPLNALAGWAETGQGAVGGSVVARPQTYVDHSPLYRLEALGAPVLLIEGDLDPAGADVLFSALYRADREAALVTYAGEGHVFVSPANLRDLHIRILDWLERYL